MNGFYVLALVCAIYAAGLEARYNHNGGLNFETLAMVILAAHALAKFMWRKP